MVIPASLRASTRRERRQFTEDTFASARLGALSRDVSGPGRGALSDTSLAREVLTPMRYPWPLRRLGVSFSVGMLAVLALTPGGAPSAAADSPSIWTQTESG